MSKIPDLRICAIKHDHGVDGYYFHGWKEEVRYSIDEYRRPYIIKVAIVENAKTGRVHICENPAILVFEPVHPELNTIKF
jgi:hypothetical protein